MLTRADRLAIVIAVGVCAAFAVAIGIAASTMGVHFPFATLAWFSI